ncbi:MAG TPA: 16S rRNA (guanine(527)-N(7))-methyltransferase RsmG [Mycobacteriales bacterium]|nr:16S rRNA (guanine(527)-N(7))-methyltransferase RsmG [Mycobacteriales bacterium]
MTPPAPHLAHPLAAAPPAPAAAVELFGERLPVLEHFAALLAGPGVERGLLGPREVERLWDRHLLNCAAVTELVGSGQTVIDLGSGAGLPGLVLAAQRPDLTVVLVEPMQRRVDFLLEAVEALGLESVRVLRGRAESLTTAVSADVVVARAVAPLAKLIGWGLPLLEPAGRLLAMKGERAAAEVAAAAEALRAARALAEVVPIGSAERGTSACVVVVRRR